MVNKKRDGIITIDEKNEVVEPKYTKDDFDENGYYKGAKKKEDEEDKKKEKK